MPTQRIGHSPLAIVVVMGPVGGPGSPRTPTTLDELEMERTQVLFCEGCGCDSDGEARGWEAHLALDEDGSTTVVILCISCSDEV